MQRGGAWRDARIDIERYQTLVAQGVEPRFAAAAVGSTVTGVNLSIAQSAYLARPGAQRRLAALLPELKERLRRDILNDIA